MNITRTQGAFIAAVHPQRRGRLFLPFADDDPRTAEVVSKVLLLARDKEIQDRNCWPRSAALTGNGPTNSPHL